MIYRLYTLYIVRMETTEYLNAINTSDEADEADETWLHSSHHWVSSQVNIHPADTIASGGMEAVKKGISLMT